MAGEEASGIHVSVESGVGETEWRSQTPQEAGGGFLQRYHDGNCCLWKVRATVCHDLALQDEGLARKQALWVADKLVWDHIQERKHRDGIELPKL